MHWDNCKLETVHDTIETLRIKGGLDIRQVDEGTITSNDTLADDVFERCSSPLQLDNEPIWYFVPASRIFCFIWLTTITLHVLVNQSFMCKNLWLLMCFIRNLIFKTITGHYQRTYQAMFALLQFF